MTTDKILSNQNTAPLFDAINEYLERNPAYFRIPGHRSGSGISSRWRELVGDEIFRYDLTETPLLDDLHHPKEAILEAEALAARLFAAQRSHFLVNGTSGGNVAMMLAAVRAGEKIAVPRNAHRSVLSGLVLGGATPVYLMPEYSARLGSAGGLAPETVERAFFEHPDIRAVMAVNPNYYGICSDLREIARLCHARGVPLLVDEAHGTHFYFSELLPEGALVQGADICAQSFHKTAGSLTQSSMLHVCSSLVNPDRVAAALRMVQSTSPSYLLMASLDLARRELAADGAEMWERAVAMSARARRKLAEIPDLCCPSPEELRGEAAIWDVDPTRLVISASRHPDHDFGNGKMCGTQLPTGHELADGLFDRHNIDVEMSDQRNIVAIVSYASRENDIDRLIDAVAELLSVITLSVKAADEVEDINAGSLDAVKLPPLVMTPREAWFAEDRAVPWQLAVDEIAAEPIAPYPPGIPMICPGERITRDIWELLEAHRLSGKAIHGPADVELKSVRVIRP
jgi:arginine/lysine/ornithine decarboxylase